jgi:tRNA (guanine37-N1)-methyltransferase
MYLVIYLTLDGVTRTNASKPFVNQRQSIMLCGHKGVGSTGRDLFVTKEISIGDYVLSGG